MPATLRPPAELEQRMRAEGGSLDPRFAMGLYAPLLARQPRDGVQVEQDLVYGEHALHRLDVYRPASASDAPRPVLIFVHGGGFIHGDKAELENLGLYMARQGFVTVIPNYRLAPQAQWPAGGEDVVAVYEWARRAAARHGGDPDQLVLGGVSVGATHVATAALLRRLQPADGLRIRGAVLMSGVYHPDLERRARRQFDIPTPDERGEAYFGSDASRYPSMSLVKLIDAAPFPLLITYSDGDPLLFQVQSGELFSTLVTAHGFAPELHLIRGHAHLTQQMSFNTEDESVSLPVTAFLRSVCG